MKKRSFGLLKGCRIHRSASAVLSGGTRRIGASRAQTCGRAVHGADVRCHAGHAGCSRFGNRCAQPEWRRRLTSEQPLLVREVWTRPGPILHADRPAPGGVWTGPWFLDDPGLLPRQHLSAGTGPTVSAVGTSMTIDPQIEKWTRWIVGPIRDDVIGMHDDQGQRGATSATCSLRTQRSRTLTGGSSMRDTYATTQAVAVQQQAVPDPASRNLATLLVELADDCARIGTEEFWVGLWVGHVEMRRMGLTKWAERFSGDVGHTPWIPRSSATTSSASETAAPASSTSGQTYRSQRPQGQCC